MNETLEIVLLKRENELLRKQNEEYKELLLKQSDNTVIAIKSNNASVKWSIAGNVIIIVVLISWLLGGYFFSSYQDHNVVNDNSNNIENSQNSAIINGGRK